MKIVAVGIATLDIINRVERYPDEETCLAEFDKIFWKDPEISSKYPQGTEVEGSYLFACQQDKPAI